LGYFSRAAGIMTSTKSGNPGCLPHSAAHAELYTVHAGNGDERKAIASLNSIN